MTNIQVPPSNKGRRFNWPRIFGYDFFISFKLGLPPIGAQSYASDLARRLRELDFTVFYSEDEDRLGKDLDSTLIKALHKSRILVVLANEGAFLKSNWVRKEVETFRQNDPTRRLIPINVDNAIEKYGPQAETNKWLLVPKDIVWGNETQQAIQDGISSLEVIEQLQAAARFMRANTRFRLAIGVIVLMLSVLTFLFLYNWLEADQKFRDATALRLIAEGGSITSGLREGGTIKGLFKVLAGHRISRSANTDEALQTEYLKFSKLIFVRQIPAVISSVAFSPDGARIVSGNGDKTLRLLDANTGQPIGQPLKGHTDAVNSVAFSPDGARIVSGSGDNTLRLWDANVGQPIGQPFRGHSDDVTSVAFSPDGKRIVSGSGDNTLRLWDANAGQPIGQPLRGHSDDVTSVAFSPDGKRIVSGGSGDNRVLVWDNTLRLWDAKTGQPIGQPLTGHAYKVSSVAFSPDGTRIVSGSGDNTLRLWDAKTGQVLGHPLNGLEDEVTSVAFSPDGTRIVSVNANGTLRLWDTQTRQLLGLPFTGHKSYVTCVAFSPDGKRIVSGNGDKTLQLWDANTGKPLGQPFTGHADKISSVAFSPDGTRIVSGSEDMTLLLWDTKAGQPIGQQFRGHTEAVNSVAFSPDGTRIVSGSGDTVLSMDLSLDNTLRLWDANTGQALGQPLKGHTFRINSVAFSPDGKRLVSGSDDNTLRLWDVFEGWADKICKKLARNMSKKEWRDWVSPDIKYIKQCFCLPIPPDEPKATTSAEETQP